ncbi:reverse transcriptase domain-containing protein [Tanacetum coccineum]
MPYPSRKIRRIRAYTHQRPRRKQAQYAGSREDQYAVLDIRHVNILEDIKRGPYSKKPPIHRIQSVGYACMSTHSSSSNLIPHFSDPESVIRNRRRNLGDPSLLLDFEEINMNPNNVQGPPHAGPPPQNHNSPPGLNLQMPAPFLRTMEELCQPTMNGRGGPIAPVNIQATDFGLKNHMIQQSMKQNGVTDDVLRLYLFPYSLTHHATAWFDRIPKNSIYTFQEMATKFLSKYFPPSMVTKLRNDISNFRQLLDESLFEAWERYKLSINRCPNHIMLPVTQIDMFYNGLTLRHRDTINVVAGGTFMKRRPVECYDLIKNMTAHYNNWDTSAHRDALPSNTEPNPREQVNSIMTRSGLTTAEPSIPPPVPPTPREEVEKEPDTFMDEELRFDISLMDALTQIPTYTKVLKDLLKNKQKLEELVNTLINVECFAILLNKVPQKLRDLRKFLIPCVLQDLEVCNSLADSGASINLMPLSIYKKLRIGPLNSTQMTLELANRSVTYPMGIAEDVIVKVDKFNFLADFVIVDFEADPRVPIILRRPFLRTAKALVDIYKEKRALRIRNKELVFRAEMFSKNSPSRERHSGHSINIIDSPCEEISNHDKQSSGSTTSHYDLSFPDYEAFCFDINHQEEKSSGSTTSRSDHSLPDYKAFYFDIDHHEEKSSVSTTSHSDPSLFEYESFYFDLLIDTLPPADRSDYHHEEFTDELAHIISPPECDHFFFDIKVDPGELTRLLIEISSSKMSTSLKLRMIMN